MWTDPIVEEVRQVRQRLWEECGGDWGKYLARMRAHREDYGERLVSVDQMRERQRRVASRSSPEQP